MTADGIVAVWIFARVEQQANDLDVTGIRSQSEGQMARLGVSVREQAAGVLGASQSRRHRQIDASATLNQSVDRFALTVQGSCMDGGVGIGSGIAKKID